MWIGASRVVQNDVLRFLFVIPCKKEKIVVDLQEVEKTFVSSSYAGFLKVLLLLLVK